VHRSWWDVLNWWRNRRKLRAESWRGCEEEEGEKASDSHMDILEYAQSPRLPRKLPPLSVVNPIVEVSPPLTEEEENEGEERPSSNLSGWERKLPPLSVVNPIVEVSPPLTEEEENEGEEKPSSNLSGWERKWPTSWYWQLFVLTVRTFRQSRHVLLSKLNIIQALCLAAVVSLIWYQVPREEESISDRYGVLFFVPLFWSFNSVVGILATFPSEHVVISKERATGTYHLSAYYLAKTLSELPLLLLLPSIFIIPVYWAAGLNGPASFFGTWFILLTNCFVAQSLGLLISAIVMDFQKSVVISVVLLLSFMLAVPEVCGDFCGAVTLLHACCRVLCATSSPLAAMVSICLLHHLCLRLFADTGVHSKLTFCV